ncbi:rho GTPase-activating protein 30 [Parambassis ranga]|uniref:Rho GTPase-activating protein 30-like n=1 Tax=Parambassis ranga TaxID=210632 RepID=A0A6P7K1E0_9TELE|nr:rho GTPase-activating protein 30-like [Parambassis ranga]XP_028283094.1 rho GTPase-activating protein 30-like [Parambassis ranga]XP_028283095.1 rho GTPase-activating protein 30-like [Parambassis ranga]
MRRVRKKGGNKEKVFGCDLLEHLNASGQEVPQVLRCCSEFVEQNGIVDGIYRLSGVSSNIQKLRGEFEGDGTPDLNKDLYLQDIHCVSSLCKAYFRELPNPLLTYQLYDKFAEAVAIQLEEERLVKIRDVLKELPAQHYRTLEFLMCHLVRMASHSSETNMHARNLAIVWAPNLLRSKDIEATGFNGTAAFMEVRVQSIVVEFILTHVTQLFPEQGVSNERRNSLPSPSAMSNPDEAFFRSVSSQPVVNFGNISPGDGPLPIRPYHAIIEGTDKRKGSLKGRKWMSIFNIGGRFQDQRRRHKHSTKEKERTPLRPARSMDSLSSPPYPNPGSRHPGQRPPSTHMSTVVTPAPQSGSDVTAVSTGAIGGSEYAVTYRRGTGLVSGGAGTQGTYTVLDPEGLGVAANEAFPSRSPGLSSKVGRRAAMHITGPTIVTVPLHITSNLALGVLQGGGDRVIHRGRDKDGGDRVEWKEGGEKEEKNKSQGEETKSNDGREDKEEEKREGNKEAAGGEEEEGDKEMMEDQGESREQQAQCLSNTEEDHNEDAADDGQDVEDNDEYMEMKGVESPHLDHRHDAVCDASDVLNSTEVVGDDQELSGYVQDNFDFLDQMDCSVLDCSVSYQMNEFSVEPPGHSDDEYEVMEQAQSSPETHTELKPHRPLSIDLHNRHTKSLSLPYMTSPVHGPEEFSEEEVVGVDSDYNDYSSDEDESMFIKSLPPDFFLKNLDSDTDEKDTSTPDRDGAQFLQSSEERDPQSANLELSACKETTTGAQQQLEVSKREDEDTEVKEIGEEVHQGQAANGIQSPAPEEQSKDAHSENAPTEASPPCCVELPMLSAEDTDESSTVADTEVEEEKEVVRIPLSDNPPPEVPQTTQKETTVVPLEESKDSIEHSDSVRLDTTERHSEEGEEKETEDTCQQFVLEIKESDEKMWEAPTEGGSANVADKTHKGGKEKETETGGDVWDVLEVVICEVIEESEQSVPGQADVVRDGEEQRIAKVSGHKMVEDNEGETNKTELRIEEEDKTIEGKLSDSESQQESEEEEDTHLSKRSDLEKSSHKKPTFNEEAQRGDREVVLEHTEKENNEQHRTQSSADKQLTDRKDLTESRKCEKSDGRLGGVGRKLVISKQPKVYQVKAVPVVPPKPQHCKITALTLRQQQQQRERRDADRGRDNTPRVPTEQEKVCAGEQMKDGDAWSTERKEKVVLRGGDRERRRDGAEAATSRNSPLSMCFDEAVAIATMRREKERVREGEAEADGSGK